MVLKTKDYNQAVDWWCLGISLYIMLIGTHPFHHRLGSKDALYKAILSDPVTYPPTLDQGAYHLLKWVRIHPPPSNAADSLLMELALRC